MSSSLTPATFFLFGIHPVNTESAVKKNNMAGWHYSFFKNHPDVSFDSLLRDDKYVRSLEYLVASHFYGLCILKYSYNDNIAVILYIRM